MEIEIYLTDEKNGHYLRKMYSTTNPDVDAIKAFLEHFKREISNAYSSTDVESKGLNDKG